MHWGNNFKNNELGLWYITLMPTITEIGIADFEHIGHKFFMSEYDLDLDRLMMAYYGFAPHPFSVFDLWG